MGKLRNIRKWNIWGRVFRKGICLTFFAAVFLSTAGRLICFAMQNEAEKNVYKYYTSIGIKQGDTLWDIAKVYMTDEYNGIEEYICEVRRINHLSGDRIYAGKYLVIPRYAADVP